MVAFKYQKTDKGEYLVTVSDPDDAVDSGIKHAVLCPMTGPFAEKRPSMFYPSLDHWWQEHEENFSGTKVSALVLRSSHHKDVADVPLFPTLRARLAGGEVKWSSHPRFGFEFSYIPFYWEWLEDILRNCRTPLRTVHLLDAVYSSLFLYECDTSLMESFCEHWCPKTNTLITAIGEASISLWDMRSIAGLPVIGQFYDEVVPSHTELLHSDKEEKPYLPPSCRYLFVAYHRIMSKTRGKVKVTFEDWCRFWFKGRPVYSVSGRDPRLPTPKKDFSGYGKVQSWDDNIHSVFQTLDIPEADRRPTYLAAFLSCWLCAFALPVEDLGYIRASVFKVASLLASGQTISLAIPVLASIYRGLNDISTSPSPGRNPSPFAAHYVYVWLASYYRSHEVVEPVLAGASMISFRGQESITPRDAKDFIYSGHKISWRRTSLGGTKDTPYNDDSRLSRQSAEFFTAMRSCYLTLRHGNSHVIEPCSPHRSARQFGFLQHIPGELECDVRDGTRERMSQLFESSVRLGTKSKFIIPRLSGSSRVSSSFDTWWKTVTPTLFGGKTSRSMDDNRAETSKSLSTGGKRKSESVGAYSPSSGRTGMTDNSEAKRPTKLRIRPYVEPLPSPSPDKPENSGRRSATPSSEPPSAQVFKGKSTEESILGILEDDVPDADDSAYFTASKIDMNIDAEIAASNLASNDVADQDLIDAINDPIIFQATASFMLNDTIDEAGLSSPKTSLSDAQDVIRAADRQAAIFVMNSMREKLVKALVSDLPSCEEEAEQYFQYVATKGVETSVLQAQVKRYLALGLELQSVRHSFLDKPSISQYEEQISTIKEKHYAAKQARDRAKSLRERLRTAASKMQELAKELGELGVEEIDLSASLIAVEDNFSKHVAVVKDLSSKQSSLEDSLAAANKELKELENLERKFDKERVILNDLAWSS